MLWPRSRCFEGYWGGRSVASWGWLVKTFTNQILALLESKDQLLQMARAGVPGWPWPTPLIGQGAKARGWEVSEAGMPVSRQSLGL